MVKITLLIGILMATLSTQVRAEDSDHKYQVGIRSGLILGKMELSGLDPVFDDLEIDGLKGAHMSGFSFLYQMRPHVRVGVETLVANSDQEAATTMNYQAAGPVVELAYGSSWTVACGLHGGGVIVNAMARPAPAPSEGATAGSYYKGSGAFLAPYVGIGRRFGRHELGVYVKPVLIFGESDRGGLDDFSASFGGVRYTFGL